MDQANVNICSSPLIVDSTSRLIYPSYPLPFIKEKKKRRSCCLSPWCHLIGFIVSLSIFITLLTTDVLEREVQTYALGKLPITEGSERASLWARGEPPIIYRIYLFNLTNPTAFRKGARPRVQEVGPFVYSVVEAKKKISYNGSLISFSSRPVFTFIKELSVEGGEDLIIKTLNIPLVNAGDMSKGPVMSKALQLIRETYSFESIHSLTVREILWGYNSRVLNFAKSIKDIPYPYDHFALFAGRNNTLQFGLTINSGSDDIDKINEVVEYDGPVPKIGCHAPKGTDGSGFKPNLGKNNTLYIYNGQLCRSLPLVFQEESMVDGLRGYKFVVPKNVFTYPTSASSTRRPRETITFKGNSRFSTKEDISPYQSVSNSTPSSNPSSEDVFDARDNTCFCHGKKCPPDGVYDMKPCLQGASVAFSFPHFLNGDPYLRHMVRGMRPDPEKHSTEFDIFPELGVPLRVKLRMQMNVVLDKNQALQRARHFDLIYPIFWFEAGIDSLPSGIVSQLRMAQTFPPIMKTVSLCASGVFAIIFLLLLTAQTFMTMCKSGLSSIRSRSLKGSEQDTRSTTPDLSSVGQGSNQNIDDDLSKQNVNSYTPFTGHQSLDNEGLGELVDNHTLLPAYKRRGSSPQQKRRVTGTSSDPTEIASEPSADNDEYPPTYHSVTSDTNVEAPGPSIPYSVMEHKPISANKVPVIHQLVTKTAPPVAPLATVEDLTIPQVPLATSSPQMSADDIEVPLPNTMTTPNTSANLSPGGVRVGAAPNTLPRAAPNRASHLNSSLPPPLESDL